MKSHDGFDAEPLQKRDGEHERLTAYVLGELEPGERSELERELAHSANLQARKAELEATIGLVRTAFPEDELSGAARERLLARVRREAAKRRGWRFLGGSGGFARLAAGLIVALGAGFFARQWWLSEKAAAPAPGDKLARIDPDRVTAEKKTELAGDSPDAFGRLGPLEREGAKTDVHRRAGDTLPPASEAARAAETLEEELAPGRTRGAAPERATDAASAGAPRGGDRDEDAQRAEPVADSAQEPAQPLAKTTAPLDEARNEESLAESGDVAVFELSLPHSVRLLEEDSSPSAGGGAAGETPSETTYFLGVVDRLQLMSKAKPGRFDLSGQLRSPQADKGDAAEFGFSPSLIDSRKALEGLLDPRRQELNLLELNGFFAPDREVTPSGGVLPTAPAAADDGEGEALQNAALPARQPIASPEIVAELADQLLGACRVLEGEAPADMFFRCFGDNPWILASEDRQSTFAADVDTASYALARSYLTRNLLPEKGQIRSEEFVNAFRADRPAPEKGPLELGFELAPSRFGPDPDTWMLRVTLRAKDVAAFERPPLALTFVVDVSGSMEEGGRLELVKSSLRLLLQQLRSDDSIALVTFRDEAEILQATVSAAERANVEAKIMTLAPEGGTNAEAGLVTGFQLAAAALAPGATHRVVLLSDGVGNIGETDQGRILAQVTEQRGAGIYLNTVGVGMGNQNDLFLEQLADQGDGSYAYVDDEKEARRALVENFTGAFTPVARDVKIQLEFDPAQVAEWRQIGYENRAVADADFANDAVDAGEINAGHQVTALYELRGVSPWLKSEAPLLQARVRYKPPFAIDRGLAGPSADAAAETATQFDQTSFTSEAAESFAATSGGYRRSVLVAQFAEILRRSIHARGDSFAQLLSESEALERELDDPYFGEFVALLRIARPLVEADDAALAADELVKLLDELCRLHWLASRPESEQAGELEKADLVDASALQEKIESLEARIRGLLRARFGLPQDEVELEPVAPRKDKK